MIQDIMEKIESYEFSAILGVASSFKLLKRIICQQEIVKELTKNIVNSPENQWLILKRIIDLSQKNIDLDYENPWDTAMTVYLWVLSLINLEVSQTAAKSVLIADNCWWSNKLANYLLTHTKSKDLDKIQSIIVKESDFIADGQRRNEPQEFSVKQPQKPKKKVSQSRYHSYSYHFDRVA